MGDISELPLSPFSTGLFKPKIIIPDIMRKEFGETELHTIDNIDITLEEATAQKVTAKEIYKILANFDKLYDKMNDIEKKKFFHTLLEKVEVHDTREKQSDGIIKKVVFKFPVFIDGQLADTVMLTKKSTVETCCLLERLRNAKDHVTFTLDMEDYYRIKDAEADKEKR